MRKALKAIFYTCAAAVVVMFFLSLLGIMDNNRGNSFGFYYRTDYVSFLLSLAMIYIAITDGWLTWLGELGLICLDAYMFWLRGKTGFACLFVLTFIVLWRHYRRNKGIPFQDKDKYGLLSYVFRVVYLPVMAVDTAASKTGSVKLKPVIRKLTVASFPVCFAVNCLLVFTYRPLKSFWENAPVLKTFKDRLIFGLLGFQEYPIRLFGNDMVTTTFGRDEKYHSLFFALDSVYLKFLLDHGLVHFIIFFGIFTVCLIWFYRKNYGIGMMILGVLAVDGIVEYQVYNWLLVLFFVVVASVYSREAGIKDCDKLSFEGWKRSSRWELAVSVTVFAAVFFIWCSTAYSISTRHGFTPECGATLVVPYSESYDDEVLDEVAEYLKIHEDSVCIVYRYEGAVYLVSHYGIDYDRVIGSGCYDIDEMLTDSYELIQQNDLPPRLTVCCYNMNLERISRHAQEHHIPINSITVKPHEWYLVYFMGEQWRLLCGD